MSDTKTMGERERWIWQARLMFAIVSARAKECPDKKCARKGHCLARFGQVGSNYYSKVSNCRNMSKAEWKVVGLGMAMNGIDHVRPFLERQDEARAAEKPKLSMEEQQRRWWSPEEVAKRAEGERRYKAFRGAPFWQMLWLTVQGNALLHPPDPVSVSGALIRAMAARGCRCAKEGKLVCLQPGWGGMVPAKCCEQGLEGAEGVFP